MNVKAISRNIGVALLVSAVFMFMSMIVSIHYGKDSSFVPLTISCIITFIVGIFPFIFVRGSAALSMRDGFVTIVLSWLLSFIFGMLPYVLWGGEFTIVNAWFESVSGFTTTGATVLNDIEALPHGLLFWRSSTNFIGGLGVVVFLMMVLPDTSTKRKLTSIEISSLSREGLPYNTSKHVQIILYVYFSIFIASTLSFLIAGMPLFDAVTNGFSITATGGFCIKNQSLGFYDSNAIYIIALVFMTLSSINFTTLYTVFLKRTLKPLKNTVCRYYLTSIAILSLLLILILKFGNGYESWGKATMDGIFTVVSYITTTGMAIVDNSGWSMLACIVLMFAALQCACAGSTTGGLKADRVLIAFKAIKRQISLSFRPTTVSVVKVGDKTLRDEVVLPVMTYFVLYFMVIFISIIMLMFCGVRGMDAFSGSISSVGNVGPGLQGIGTAGNFSYFPSMAKVVCSIDMLLGRLEIYPILVMLGMIFRREK